MSIVLGPIFNTRGSKILEWSVTLELRTATGAAVEILEPIQTMSVGDSCYAVYHTLSGYTGMKMTQSAETEVRTGKNIGKKNETNVLTQAYKEILSKYNSKLKAGYLSKSESSSLELSDMTIATVKANRSIAPYPMAVKSWKDHGSKLGYPLFVQPKLDGCRLVTFYHEGEVKLVTRRLQNVSGFDELRLELKTLFESSGFKTFFIDGELYQHGMNLQTISGIVRGISTDESEKNRLKFYVFDCFDVSQPLLDFEDRFATLTKIMSSIPNVSKIVLHDTERVETSADADEYYQSAVNSGYEGVIYKSLNKPYDFDYDKEKRSAWYLKRKKQEDAEFPIVGFTEGKGKDKGCIVFELETNSGARFKCVPNGTYEYRKSLYNQAINRFASAFDGKLAKVAYDDTSKIGTPLRGRITQIGRDLSFD